MKWSGAESSEMDLRRNGFAEMTDAVVGERDIARSDPTGGPGGVEEIEIGGLEANGHGEQREQ